MADGLKSSFDLAMERMAKRGEAMASLTPEQKAAMAELSSRTKAKIAEIEILYGKKIDEACEAKDADREAKTREEMRFEINRLKDREEAERAKIRNG